MNTIPRTARLVAATSFLLVGVSAMAADPASAGALYGYTNALPAAQAQEPARGASTTLPTVPRHRNDTRVGQASDVAQSAALYGYTNALPAGSRGSLRTREDVRAEAREAARELPASNRNGS